MSCNDDVVNSPTSNNIPKCVWTEQKSFKEQKGIPTELEGKTDKSTIRVKHFNILSQ